ncbi:MAG: amino acid adenylation domain-containing protein [Rhodanobacteraceae bacterium]|nr:amino acid adenylation domain-containing protein [Rhodanobacteraceae bacterium]
MAGTSDNTAPDGVYLAAGFTAQPLVTPLRAQLAAFGLPAAVGIAPFGQLFQLLLGGDPAVMVAAGSANVLLVRAEDLLGADDRRALAAGEVVALDAAVARGAFDAFAQAVRTFAATRASDTLLLVCPSSLERNAGVALRGALHELEERIASAHAGETKVVLDVLRDGCVAAAHEIFDATRDTIAQIPYSERYFAHIARRLALRLAQRRGLGPKLLAVDADDTLWQGACGEQEPAAIVITPAQQRLQRRLREAREHGMLLALVSKNHIDDVRRVFQQNSRLELRLDDFAALRVNWQPKSVNLSEIACELNLSVDSFVMLDDNAVELAEIAAAHAGVMLWQVPQDEHALQRRLDRAWLFDSTASTDEDGRRNRMYAEERARQSDQGKFQDLDAFLDSLALEVTFEPLAGANLTRAAQLTARTNQFNLRKCVRSEDELAALLAHASVRGVVLRVRDRFGDYGLTGVVIVRKSGTALDVDTWLLSCRVLGRRVEDCVLQRLCLLAQELDCNEIVFPLVLSAKNIPIQEFLETRFSRQRRQLDAHAIEYRVPLAQLQARGAPACVTVRDANAVAAEVAAVADDSSETLPRLLALVRENLGLAQDVAADDDYFALGGNSLKAVDLIAAAARQGLSLELDQVMACRSVAALARAARVQIGAVPTCPPAPFALLRDSERGYLDSRLDVLELDDAFPLSALQHGMLYHALQGAAERLYENLLCWYVDLAWNENAWRKALRLLQRRHAGLRTCFLLDAPERPLQVVARDSALRLDVFDLGALDAAQQDAALRDWSVVQRERALDLAAAPWCAAVHQLSARRFHFALHVHHVLLDGWSHRRALDELLETYAGLLEGAPPMLRAAPPSYAALVERELSALADPGPRAHWAIELRGATLSSWAGVKRTHSERLRYTVPAALGERIGALAVAWGVHERSVWCLTYAALLALLEGQGNVLGNSVTHTRPELEGASESLGAYLNSLPLRCDLRGRSWRENGQHVHSALRTQFRHRFYPAAQIRRDSGLELGTSLFNYIEAGRSTAAAQPSPHGVEHTHYPFAFTVEKDAAGTQRVILDVDAGLLPDFLRQHLPEQVARILDVITRDDTAPFRSEDLLDADDRASLARWAPAPAFHSADFVHQLAERQAATTPDAIALVHEGHALSYRELHNRANWLARRLRVGGVGVEDRIGVYCRRGLDCVIGVLAAVKAGACYVPLDPSHPSERTAFVLADAGVHTLLFDTDLPQEIGTAALRFDLRDAFDGYSNTENYASLAPTALGLHPENLVYWLYTSGSTGQPKGVMIRHAGLSNLVQDSIARRGFNGECRNLQFAPLGFDAASAEIFNSLCSGSILHLPPSTILTDAEAFRAYSQRHAVNRGYIPPAFLSVLDAADFARHRSLSVGGEAIPQELAQRWSRVCTLTNAYGPTECTIACTSGTLDGSGNVSIGSFLSNVHGYVLGEDLQLLPRGVAGELCIAGECLARGYAGDRALTALRFVPNPFDPDRPGSRLYRTGDLVRYRADGKLEFVGRRDQQVKLRGHRIELGEVEAQLAAHPALQAAVASVQGEGEQRKLVLHYTVRRGADVDVAELRAFALRLLPRYMVPSAFGRLAVLPLSANGKLDRRALPVLSAENASAEAPQYGSDLEARVAALWASALGVACVRRDDSFFEIGGHSLLALHVVQRVRDSCGVTLGIRDLLDHQVLCDFAALVAQRAAAPSASAPTLAAHEPAQLAPAQQRLWFLHKYIGENSVFNISLALELCGVVDRQRLRAAIDATLTRHEALRTRFIEVDGAVTVALDAPAPDVLVETRVADAAALEAELKRQRRHCFRLDAEPLYRFSLIAAPSGEGVARHVLQVTVHHSVCDGHSLAILLRELAQHYNGMAETLPLLPLRYADCVAWQQRELATPSLQAQRAYWREALRDLPPTLDLPLDFERPAEQSYRGATRKTVIARATVDALRSVAQRHGATLFMGLVTAFAVLLSRYARQHDLAIGSAISNRPLPGSENLVGLFVNMLVLRFGIAPHEPFSTLLRAAKVRALDAYRNQDLPFEHLVEELRPQRSTGHAPLFQVSFSLIENPLKDLALDGVELRLIDDEEPDGVSRYDLALSLAEFDDGLVVTTEYDSALFAPDTINRLQVHYRRLLEAVVAAPDTPVGRLEFLTPAERLQQLHDWNSPRTARDIECGLYTLIEPWLRTAPDAIALVSDGASYTYAALDRAVGALAAELVRRGFGAGARIGLAIPRSYEMLVAVLACLKAGFCYVPLDPQLPPARSAYVAADAQLQLLIGEAGECALRMRLDELRSVLRSGVAVPPPPGVTHAQQLAYLLYTSGSSGKPKGVGVSHASLINFCKSIVAQPGIASGARLLAVTTLSFDIAFLELVLPLTCGATVEIAAPDEIFDGAALARRLARGIDVMQATPSTWKLLLDAQWPGARGLKALVGGEALPPALALALHGKVGELWNMYGPTETTIWSTLRCVDGPSVDIGRPLRNTRAYVLDAEMQLLPAGALGELYLGGDGVAQGYFGRPGLTAERFVPDPFAGASGARLYRTGDVVRYRADGNIEYVGRNDQQVKVRGYRIELGEIEQVLAQCDGLKDAAAAVRTDTGGNHYIAAYLVPIDATSSNADALLATAKQRLADALPAYMQPSAYLLLDALPRTANGKLDRQALPAVDGAALAAPYAPPQGPQEMALAAIWADLLQRERVGRDDNFFELGGHSLLVAQLVARIAQQCGVVVGLKDVFAAPRLSQLALQMKRLELLQGAEESVVDELSDEDVQCLLSELQALEGEDAALDAGLIGSIDHD